jgi:ERF superfamily
LSELSIKRSDSIGQLVAALALAQTEFETISKDHVNPYYKSRYADLSDVIAATQPALNKNGLTIIQIPLSPVSGRCFAGAFSMLAHTSGEFISTELLLPVKEDKYDAQGVGSSITYARRYTWQAMVGAAAEDDDDGNAAAGRGESSSQSEQPWRVPKPPAVNQNPATTGGSRPNQSPKPAPEPPASAQGSAQTGETKAEAPGLPSAADLDAVAKEREVAASTAKSTTSEQSEPDKKADVGGKPNKTAFDAYTARAVALKQPLEKAGLKPSKGLQTGAKLKNHLLASAGAKELADLTVGQWEAWLQILENLAKTDPAKAVEIIDPKIEGGK